MLGTLTGGTENPNVNAGINTTDSIAQLISVLVIFVLVLVLTLVVTRWLANYQKGTRVCGNIEVLETCATGNGKYIQIVRLGKTYVAMAVCKDNVTLLAEVPKDQLVFPEGTTGGMSFKDLLLKAKTAQSGMENTTVEDSLKEE